MVQSILETKYKLLERKAVHKFVFACILTLSFLNIFLSLWSQILYANCIVFKHLTKNLIRNQKEMLKVSKITEQVGRENLKATTKMKWEINEDERKKQSYIFLNLGNRKDIEQWCKSFFFLKSRLIGLWTTGVFLGWTIFLKTFSCERD